MKKILAIWLIAGLASSVAYAQSAPFSPATQTRTVSSEYASTSGQPSDVIGTRAISARMTPPRNLTGLVYSSSTVELFWERASSAVAVQGYEVFRDGVLLTSTQGISHVDRNLMPNTAYQYQVQALFADGTRSQPTQVYTLKTFQSGSFGDGDIDPDPAPSVDPSPDNAPGKPPSPTGLNGKVYGQKSLEVFWDRQKDRRYQYLVRFNGTVVERTSGTSWYTNQAKAGAVNQIAVATIDDEDRQSDFVGLELLTRGAAMPSTPLPDAPLELRGEVYGNSTVELFWKRANPTDSRFRVYIDGIVFGDTNGTSIIVRKLREGTTFVFSVVTLDADGAQSEMVSIELSTRGRPTPAEPTSPTAPEPEPTEPEPPEPESPEPEPAEPIDPPDLDAPPTPTGLRGVPYGKRTIEIFWDRSPVPGVDYFVYLDEQLVAGPIEGISWLVRDLTPATDYTFNVSAVNSAGVESKLTESLIVTTGGQPVAPVEPEPAADAPATPTGLRGEIYSRSKLELFWERTEADRRGEYTLYRIYVNGVLARERDGNSVFFRHP